MGDPRRVTQELVEIEYQQDSPNRRVTQELAEIEYSPATPNRRVTQLLVEIEYLAVPDEDQTQIRGWDQIQPWSITSDRLSAEVAGAGLRGGGAGGPLWVDVAIYPPPTAQGQALIADGTPQWTPTLTPTWLGEHTFNAGLVVAAAQAITMGDQAYIGCGPADVRIVFDAGNDISLMGGPVGINTAAPLAKLDVVASESVWSDVVRVAGTGSVTLGLWRFRASPTAQANPVMALIGTGSTSVQFFKDITPTKAVGIGNRPFAITDSPPTDDFYINTYDGVNPWVPRVVVLNSGSVGVSTIVPDRLFHVEVADSATNSVTYAQRLSHITDQTVVAGFGVGLEFELEENDASNRVAAIIEAKWSDAGESAAAHAYLDFLTMHNDGAAVSRMVVGYNGNVGIGTTTPGGLLTVEGNIALLRSGCTLQLRPVGNAYNWNLQAVGLDLVLTGGATERVKILSSGNFGIGTSAADRLLHAEVADSATNSVTYAQRLSHITDATAVAGFGVGLEFELEENDASNKVAAIIEAKWSDAGESTNADGYLDFLTMLDDGAAASRMVVGHNTHVGIGISTPNYRLDVYHPTDDFVAHFQSNDDLAGVVVVDDDTTGYLLVKDGYISIGGNPTLATGNLNVAIATGYVGIGTIAPGGILELASGGNRIVFINNRIERWDSDTDNVALWLNYQGYQGGSTRYRDVYIGDGKTNAVMMVDGSLASVGIGTSSPDRLLNVEVADSATNSVTYAQRLSHVTDGTAVAGFGVGLEFELEENDGTNRVAALIETKWQDAGEGVSATAYLDFKTMLIDGAAVSRMVVGYTGYVGIGTPTPTSLLTVEGGATELRTGCTLQLRPANNLWNWNLQAVGGDLRITSGAAEVVRILLSGFVGIGTTGPNRLLHAEVSDSATNAVVYAQRLSHVTDATAAALFGVGLEMELEDAGNNNRVASMFDTLWADPAAATYTSLLRWQNTHIGAQGGYGGFVALNNVAGVAMPIIPNGAGDVAVTLTAVYAVSESAGGTSGGSATVLNNSSVDLYDDGTDTLTLAVAADGSVTLQRTAGAATFDVSLWMVWL